MLAAGLLIFLALSTWLSVIDIREHRLPNRLVAAAGIVGLVTFGGIAIVTGDPTPLVRALLASGACFGGYLLIHLVSRGNMGAGDVKLAAVLGLYLGWFSWVTVAAGVCAGFALGAGFSVLVIIARRAHRRSHVAFGPWMLAGAWVAIGASIAAPVFEFA